MIGRRPEPIRENREDLHLLHIFIDADACPVKQEVYRVAGRYGLDVTLVANAWMRVPNEPWIALKVVADGFRPQPTIGSLCTCSLTTSWSPPTFRLRAAA